jgi:hypothetical protein
MYLAIITISLLGSIATGLFGRKIGFRNTKFSILVVLTLIVAITAHLEYLNSIPASIQLFTWIDSESLNIFGDSNLVLLGSSISNAAEEKEKILKDNKGKAGVYR